MIRKKYSDDQVREAVASSFSIAAAIRKLGLVDKGGNYKTMHRKIEKLGLDTSHFTGQGWNIGGTSTIRRSPSKILVLRDRSRPQDHGQFVRRALLELGVPYVCSCCGIGPEWNGKPMTLEVDHRNGNRWDNRRRNVRFICPNCHTQTNNYKIKNIGKTGAQDADRHAGSTPARGNQTTVMRA